MVAGRCERTVRTVAGAIPEPLQVFRRRIMNAYQQARTIEEVAKRELMPWLMMRSEDVQEVPPGLFLQRLAGDFIILISGKKYGFELKAEEKHTNNLYLEVWSNLPELTPGWMITSRADYLGYYFLDLKVLYIARMRQLQHWAFGADGKPGQIYRFPEKQQSKYSQLNFTTGRCVPVAELQRAGLLKEFTDEDRRQ